MFSVKYPEKDGIRVYTKISSWSDKRREEYKLREWEKIS